MFRTHILRSAERRTKISPATGREIQLSTDAGSVRGLLHMDLFRALLSDRVLRDLQSFKQMLGDQRSSTKGRQRDLPSRRFGTRNLFLPKFSAPLQLWSHLGTSDRESQGHVGALNHETKLTYANGKEMHYRSFQ